MILLAPITAAVRVRPETTVVVTATRVREAGHLG